MKGCGHLVVRAIYCPDPALAGQEATRHDRSSLPVAALRSATRATSSPDHQSVKTAEMRLLPHPRWASAGYRSAFRNEASNFALPSYGNDFVQARNHPRWASAGYHGMFSSRLEGEVVLT